MEQRMDVIWDLLHLLGGISSLPHWLRMAAPPGHMLSGQCYHFCELVSSSFQSGFAMASGVP